MRKNCFVMMILAAGTIAVMPDVALANAVDSKQDKLTGGYIVYSGEMGDWSLPTADDAKVAIEFTGPLAQAMFRGIGSAGKSRSCSEDGETRSRGDIVCTRTIKGGETSCYVGYDIRRGKPIGGIIC
jgi:hypothetical protein